MWYVQTCIPDKNRVLGYRYRKISFLFKIVFNIALISHGSNLQILFFLWNFESKEEKINYLKVIIVLHTVCDIRRQNDMKNIYIDSIYKPISFRKFVKRFFLHKIQ